MEQIVDSRAVGGGLQEFRPGQGSSASSSVSPGHAGEGVFRTFLQNQKSAKWSPHSGSKLSADFTSSTPAAQLASNSWYDVELDQTWLRFVDNSGRSYWCLLRTGHCPRGSEDREGASDSVPVLRQGRGGRWLVCGCSQPPVLTVPGCQSVMEAFGIISFYVPLAALFAHGNLDFAFTLVSFSLRCLGVALSTLYSGRVLGSTVDTCSTRGFWRTSHIFYVWCTQFAAFLSIPQNGEVCTVDASSCSVSSRASHFESGHYFCELFM